MTNAQLLLSIGIPTLVILIRFWRSDKRLNEVDKRFDRLDQHLDIVGAELRYFHGVISAQGADIETLKKRTERQA